MSDHPSEKQATEQKPPRKDDGPLSPDPLRGKTDSNRPQTQKDPVKTPQEQSD